ncbi:MAG TPA: FAD-dependent oxidoreductase [Nakamurella sp.]
MTRQSDRVVDVLVVGAGVAGLVAARDLARAGLHPLVLEAAAEPGGCVRAHRVGGLLLDAGAESFATSLPSVTDLVGELGLSGSVVLPDPAGAWLYAASGAVPLPRGGILGIPARPWAADVRRVIGPGGAARALADLVLPRNVGMGPAATLGSAVRTRMGRRVRDRLVAPVAGGVYSADPASLQIEPRLRDAVSQSGSLSAAASLLRTASGPAGSAVAGLAGGMHTLIAALVADLQAAGGTLATESAVMALTPDGLGWRAQVGGSRPRRVRARQVLVAVDGPAAAALLDPVATRPVRSWAGRTADVLVTTLVVTDARLDMHPRGTGVLVAPGTRVRAKALTHATAKWAYLQQAAGAGRHVLRLSYGRSGEALPAAATLRTVALADATALTGVHLHQGQVEASAVVRWPTLAQAPPGHSERVSALRAELPGEGTLAVAGAVMAGTGLAAVVQDARRAASELIGNFARTARHTPRTGTSDS